MEDSENKCWLVVEWKMEEVQESEELHLADQSGYVFLSKNKERISFTDAAEFDRKSPINLGHTLVGYIGDHSDEIGIDRYEYDTTYQELKSVIKQSLPVANIAYHVDGGYCTNNWTGYTVIEKRQFQDIFSKRVNRLREVANAITSRGNRYMPYGPFPLTNTTGKQIGIVSPSNRRGIDEICLVLEELDNTNFVFSPSDISEGRAFQQETSDELFERFIAKLTEEMEVEVFAERVHAKLTEETEQETADKILTRETPLAPHLMTDQPTPTEEDLPSEADSFLDGTPSPAPVTVNEPQRQAEPDSVPVFEPEPKRVAPMEQIVITKTEPEGKTKWRTQDKILSIIGTHLEEIKLKSPPDFWLPVSELTRSGYNRTTLASERERGSKYVIWRLSSR